ncbi:MAG: DUF4097 domain-containing protein, partial [Defluviitaleaceae bacterium]|nr:DUF4097 domain-containing protein [Defluviitaleaceae bacterium]
MENNNDTGERKGLKNINWNKLAIILILLGVGMLAIGRLSGSRGGMIAFENGRLRVLQDEQSDFTPLPRSREITHIAVNATYANIIIETTPPGETDGIHFTNISPEYFDVSDGKITIDSRPVGRRWVLFQLSPGRREIRINLPPGTEIWEIETRTVSGGIRFYNLQAREVVAVATSGSVRSENSDFGNTYLRSTSGAVNLSGFTWENLQAQSTSGSVRISDGEIRSATGATGAAGVAGVAGETRLQS